MLRTLVFLSLLNAPDGLLQPPVLLARSGLFSRTQWDATPRGALVAESYITMVLPDDESAPVVPARFVKVKGEMLTPYGVLLGLSVFATAFGVQLAILSTYLWSKLFDPKRRRSVDWVITFWAWFSMRLCGYCPVVEGLENMPAGNNFLVCPNHSSFLDILTLTGFIPRPMKYVSKDSILNIPFIGWPMKLAGHIALKTDSRRSQLETFKNTVACLKDGNTVITFPEGTRSADGRLCSFKRGPFKMAIQSSTPIVPVTIYNLARWYPKGTLLPVDVPKGVKIVIHPPIDPTDADVKEAELAERVFDIVNAALPSHQQAAADMPKVAV